MRMLNTEKLNAALDVYESEGCYGTLRITEGEGVIFERNLGYANAQTKEPFTKDSMFTLYSLSKPFCAIGLMKLYDRGLVDIDEHPGKYLEEARTFHKNLKIYQLLNHTSGIPDYMQTVEFKARHVGKGKNEWELLPILAEYEGFFAPGEDGRYTNVNFVIPAMIIERVTGMPYSEYMKAEVFEPLGMKCAVVDREGMFIEHRVQGHDRRDGGRLVPVGKTYFSMFGAGDICATVDDVYCLNLAIKNKLLLSERSWERILTPSPINDMGYGCMVYDWHGKRRIQHNGGSMGFRTMHFRLPEYDLDVILLTNSGFGEYRDLIAEAIHDSYFGESTEKAKKIEMDKGYI